MEPDDPRREWLPRRRGTKPRTTPDDPHRQLTQIAPVELQDQVVERGRALPGVFVTPSTISLPGARAFVLEDSIPIPSSAVFLAHREFAHIHPPVDGSLHMVLPPHLLRQILERGWGEVHPVARAGLIPPTTLMVYGPRDSGELEVVMTLLTASYDYARGAQAT